MAAIAALTIAAPAGARANGAFPAVEDVLLPRTSPRNSRWSPTSASSAPGDGGQSWSWSCEQEASASACSSVRARRRAGGCSPSPPTTASSIPMTPPAAERMRRRVARGQAVSRRVYDRERGTGAGDRASRAARCAVLDPPDGGEPPSPRRLPGGRGRCGPTSVESARADPRVVYITIFAANQSPRLRAHERRRRALGRSAISRAGIGAGVRG